MTKPNYETIVLQVANVAVSEAIDRRKLLIARNQVEILAAMEMMSGNLVVYLQAYLAAGDRQQVGEDTVTYLADWRQWFKARWFNNRMLRWLLRKYPLRHKTIKVPTVWITRVCPHLAIPIGSNKFEILKPHFDHCLTKDQPR